MRGEPNRLLRAERDRRQQTRGEFAREVQPLAGLPCDARTVQRWEDGTVRLPRPAFRRAVIELTGLAAADLGWTDPVDNPPLDAPTLDPDALLRILRRAERAAQQSDGPGRTAALQAVVHSYGACSLALTAAGDHAAAWVAADRAVALAALLGDVSLTVEGTTWLVAVHTGAHDPDRARRTAESARTAITTADRPLPAGLEHRLLLPTRSTRT